MVACMTIIAIILKSLFMTYTLMLLARVLGSWIPQAQGHPIMRFLAHYTDPYLNFFRKIIPPIGGVLDLSPMLALLALQFLQMLLFRFLFS